MSAVIRESQRNKQDTGYTKFIFLVVEANGLEATRVCLGSPQAAEYDSAGLLFTLIHYDARKTQDEPNFLLIFRGLMTLSSRFSPVEWSMI